MNGPEQPTARWRLFGEDPVESRVFAGKHAQTGKPSGGVFRLGLGPGRGFKGRWGPWGHVTAAVPRAALIGAFGGASRRLLRVDSTTIPQFHAFPQLQLLEFITRTGNSEASRGFWVGLSLVCLPSQPRRRAQTTHNSFFSSMYLYRISTSNPGAALTSSLLGSRAATRQSARTRHPASGCLRPQCC